MQRHFHEELEALKQTLLSMGGLVEDQIHRVMRALILAVVRPEFRAGDQVIRIPWVDLQIMHRHLRKRRHASAGHGGPRDAAVGGGKGGAFPSSPSCPSSLSCLICPPET